MLHLSIRSLFTIACALSLNSLFGLPTLAQTRFEIEAPAILQGLHDVPNDPEWDADTDVLIAFLQRYEARVRGTDEILDTKPFLFIPHGRSVQKNHTDVLAPRHVGMLTNWSSDTVALPPTFFGYAARAHQAEILAWDTNLKKYKPFLITNLGYGRKPRIEKPDPAFCMKCHQHNLAPIFASSQWREVLVPSLINQTRFEAHLKPLRQDNELNPFQLDSEVRTANAMAQAGRLCTDLCGSDTQCRKGLLLLTATLLGNRLDNSLSSQQIDLLQRLSLSMIKKKWPTDGFSYPSSVLPDRDPSQREPFFTSIQIQDRKQLRVDLARLVGLPTVSHQIPDLADSHEPLDYNETLAPIIPIVTPVSPEGFLLKPVSGSAAEAALDPRTRRPRVSSLSLHLLHRSLGFSVDGLNFAGICFNLNDHEQNQFLSLPLITVARAILTNPKIESLLTQQWPPAKTRLLSEIQKEKVLTSDLARVEKIAKSTITETGDSPTVVPSVAPQNTPIHRMDDATEQHLSTQLRLDSPRALGLLHKYCASCHVDDQTFGMAPSIAFESPAELRKWGPRIIRSLRNYQMPDTSFGATPLPSDRERAALIQFLRNLEN